MYNTILIHIMSRTTSPIMATIEELQEQYYKINNKNTFFKKKQKYECAELVTTQIGIDTILEKCIYIFDNNKVHIDYPIFKTFANPNNYHDISVFLATTINNCIKKHKSFEIFINLDTLTISAVERHRHIIIGFAECGERNGYEKYLTNMELLNTPSFITTTTSILSSFISPKVTELVKIHKK
jgi:hypothetical protein